MLTSAHQRPRAVLASAAALSGTAGRSGEGLPPGVPHACARARASVRASVCPNVCMCVCYPVLAPPLIVFLLVCDPPFVFLILGTHTACARLQRTTRASQRTRLCRQHSGFWVSRSGGRAHLHSFRLSFLLGANGSQPLGIILVEPFFRLRTHVPAPV